jgi:predicted nucleic acid-binding protein
MILLDTNIFIYLANQTLPSNLLDKEHVTFASVSKIEALGYGKISAREQDLLEQWFDECQQISLDDQIIYQAIKLRLQKSISLGDAIIAATALANDLPVWTANTADFAHIDKLRLHNPLQAIA